MSYNGNWVELLGTDIALEETNKKEPLFWKENALNMIRSIKYTRMSNLAW